MEKLLVSFLRGTVQFSIMCDGHTFLLAAGFHSLPKEPDCPLLCEEMQAYIISGAPSLHLPSHACIGPNWHTAQAVAAVNTWHRQALQAFPGNICCMALAASLKVWLLPCVQHCDDLVFPCSMKANHPTKLIIMMFAAVKQQ